MLLNRKQIFGLDIGSTHIKAVQLKKELRSYTLTAVNVCPIAPWGSDTQMHRQNTIKAIQQCIEPMNMRTRFSVCGVSGPDVAVRTFELPRMKPEELKGAITFEAAQVCPFEVSYQALDFQVINDDPPKITGFFVAANEAVVKFIKQATGAANLRCVLMDVDGLALLNAFHQFGNKKQEHQKHKDYRPETPVAILNIGSSHTTLVIQTGTTTAPLIRDITCAGNSILSEMGMDPHTPREDVSRLLFERSKEDQAGYQAALEQACRYLIEDVTKTLQYYENQNSTSPIEHLWICGGLALLPGLMSPFNKTCPLEASLWNPSDNIRTSVDKPQEELASKAGPMLAVALGLAMRSI